MNYLAFAGISEIDNLYTDAQRKMEAKKILDKENPFEEQEGDDGIKNFASLISF